MSRLLLSLLIAVIGFTSIASQAQDNPDPNRQTIAAIRNLLQQRPDDPTLYYFLASFQARVKDRDDALASLKKVMEIGEGFLPLNDFGFENLKDDPEFQALRAEMEKKLPKVADAPVAFRISDKTFIPEGIAYDAAAKSFYVGSVAQKRIVKVGSDGKVAPFSKDADGLQHILGIAIDQKRRILYAASTNALTEAGRKQPFNAVVRYDLKTGKRTGEVRVPEAQQLNDVAIGPNGDVYASDSASGAIWRVFAKPGVNKTFIAPGGLRGTNGIAVSQDGKTLYAAHSTGIVRIDTATAKIDRMLPPPRETVAAIDGLYVWQGDLIGIQNVTNPGRVIRIRLGGNGTEIKSVDTLQSHHHPDFDEPTTGAIAGDAIYVLATTQVARFDEKGELKDAATLKPPAVVKVPR